METGWEVLDLVEVDDGRYETTIGEHWQLIAIPQGGVVAAIAVDAMERALGDPGQQLRTMTALFAGQVAGGPVAVDVRVIRRGRSMSQLEATVRNPGADAGLTIIAAFGRPRRGFEFTELVAPDVEGPEGARGFRDPLPEGIDFELTRPPMPFWERVVEARPVIGRPPWEEFDPDVEARQVNWMRLDHPPRRADGSIHVAASVVLCDTMPGSVGQKIGPDHGDWFAPSVDYTLHCFGPPAEGWMLIDYKARQAGDGYASVESALWDMADPSAPRLVAHACQMMFFIFLEH
jgi:acyl-CoA thioesterase